MEYRIEDMHCDGCARGARAAVRAADPDAVVELDPPTRRARIDSTRMEAVLAALDEAGFPAVAA